MPNNSQRLLFTGAQVFMQGRFRRADIAVASGRIVAIGDSVPAAATDVVFPSSGLYVVPGLADVHTHLREPGFSYKETIRTGTLAAAHGGVTAVCSMPNLNPAPDCYETLRPQLELIERDACIHVSPVGCLTMKREGKEPARFDELLPHVCAFSDDGSGIQDRGLMTEIMTELASHNALITAHCEDNSLLRGGYIHDGVYAAAHGHRGICSESEWGPIARDLELVAQTGVRYHVCHISTKESVALIREAKRSGLPVTCETGPHYLMLCDEQLKEDACYKMNPPIRSRADRSALLEGLFDGTIDCIATDHAPHSAEEKSKGLEKSAMGIVGIETSFVLLYEYLGARGFLTLAEFVDRMCLRPRQIFGLPGGTIAVGEPADLTFINMMAPSHVNPDEFLSKGRSTPFTGYPISTRIERTLCGGSIVYEREA